MSDISIGNEIKDGFKRTDKWIKVNIQWLEELQGFYTQRAQIEREYAEKLNALTTEAFKSKAKASSVVSVGENPLVTPGSLESASMVAWNEVLTQSENIAKERRQLAKQFDNVVASSFSRMQNRYEAIRQRWKSADEELKRVRDEHYDDVSKAKKVYDDACQAMESQRSKAERGRGQDKLAKRERDMKIAKNDYLIKINVANRLKDKYYYQDVPELLDSLQTLNESKVSRVNSIWLSAGKLERACNEKVSSYLKAEDAVISQNLPRLDTAMYVKHNMGSWKEAADFQFEPSPIWHDEPTMAIDDADALDKLKVQLGESSTAYERYESRCQEEKQALEETVEQRQKLVGDTFNVVQIKSSQDYTKLEDLLGKSVTSLQQFANDDTHRVCAEVEIEVIQTATDGQDMTISRSATKVKKSRFGGLLGKKTVKEADNGDMQSITSSMSHITVNSSGRKNRLFGMVSSAVNAVSGSVGGTVGTNGGASTDTTATANYRYDSTGDDELTVAAGTNLVVVEDDDGSGWTCVRDSTGSSGLVPTSYLTIRRAESSKKQGPKVAPRRGKKVNYVEALYDYTAQGGDELTIHAGDKIVVTKGDDNGWTEGELNGQVGLFPSSYVK